jgi:predicted phage terminase large subunit-like protein
MTLQTNILSLSEQDIDVIAANATADDLAFLRAQKAKIERSITLEEARFDLIKFARLMFPDPSAMDDLSRSLFDVQPHHRLIAEAMEKVAKGEILRLIISMPPRHGKSELVTRCGTAWFAGLNPWAQIILGGYAQDFAETEFGRKIKRLMDTDRYKEVFPEISFGGGSKAVDELMLSAGGQIMSKGRGGGTTGKGADLFIIDDPIKDAKEADSETIRKDVWEWFNTVASTRLMPGGRIVIIMTRWHEDDLVGRLIDPQHPQHNPAIARQWTVLKLPGVFTEEHTEIAKVLGKKVGDSLWPARYPPEHINNIRIQSPRTYTALYQGDPTPPEGSLFQADWLHEYRPEDLPAFDKLNIFAASDHATSLKRHGDPSVIGLIGVDYKQNVYVLPDLVWKKLPIDQLVEAMLQRMRKYQPRYWWMENENISKAFGPFLRKRMIEENVYCPIVAVTPSADKVLRSSAIQGRMQQGKVFFPGYAPWWPQAKNQILRFPNALHDDFVDFISWIGIGLESLYGQSGPPPDAPREFASGTIGWLKRHRERERRQAAQNTSPRVYGVSGGNRAA